MAQTGKMQCVRTCVKWKQDKNIECNKNRPYTIVDYVISRVDM